MLMRHRAEALTVTRKRTVRSATTSIVRLHRCTGASSSEQLPPHTRVELCGR